MAMDWGRPYGCSMTTYIAAGPQLSWGHYRQAVFMILLIRFLHAYSPVTGGAFRGMSLSHHRPARVDLINGLPFSLAC